VRISKQIIIGTMIVNGLGINAVFAGFVVPTETQGNSQTTRFKQAIEGASSITVQEQEALSRILPEKVTDRYYGRVHLNNGSIGVKSSAVTVNNTQLGAEFAIGHISKTWRMELEYLSNKNFNITKPTFLSTVKTNVVLANFYYDWDEIGMQIQPYAVVGGGAISSTISFKTIPATQTQTSKKLNLAWGVGAGLRARLLSSNWFLGLGGRYMSLGKVSTQPPRTGALSHMAVTGGFSYVF
jgi:opacity protein-like surface antigen